VKEKFIDYDDLYKILHEKFNANHDEIRFWLYEFNGHNINDVDNFFINDDTVHFLLPFTSDLPNLDGYYDNPSSEFDPTLCFFYSNNVENFVPTPYMKIVYIKDLSGKRNWQQSLRSETNLFSNYPALDRAAESGLLRFYDRSSDKFTLYQKSKSGDPKQDKLWILTNEGQEYVTQPDNFFLLSDIINIERIFFKRSRNDCLEELCIDLRKYV
jgi:hypothetical protein